MTLDDFTEQIYMKGFQDGLKAYAHWKDGQCFVGTTGMLLKQAIKEAVACWNYNPPISEESICLKCKNRK